MTTVGARAVDGLTSLRWVPSARELADVELILDGALPPLSGLPGRAELIAVLESGRLPSGAPLPHAPTLRVPPEAAAAVPTGPEVVLTDDEGAPVAALLVTERWDDGASTFAAGDLRRLATPAHGPARSLHRTPADVRAELGGAPAVAVVARRPLLHADIAALTDASARLGARILVLLAVGAIDAALPPAAVVPAVQAAAHALPAGTVVASVTLSSGADPDAEAAIDAHVAAAYGATALLGRDGVDIGAVTVITGGATDVEHEQLVARLDAGGPIPAELVTDAVARVLRRSRPPRRQRGLTIFFTGLSGSGKSTVARGVADTIADRSERTVSLLDGDVVRRLLSSGLTFSRADRDLNIRRIGYVAAEVTRHGGTVICAPIAPYAATRAQVRAMVEALGDFVLVHVSTPLAVCEERDRKGLYAKARAGIIPEFTGISDPYEEPVDADLRLDTSTMSIPAAVDQVLARLVAGGWIGS